MTQEITKTVAIIVTHPDEETLWAGGTILNHPSWKCFVVCLSKANDPELAPRFYNALKLLKSEGVMGNFDELTHKKTVNEKELERNIIQLLPDTRFDIIITHNSFNGNSDNQQHQSVNKCVIKLWKEGIIAADELWTFANEDGNMKYYPNSIEQPQVLEQLPHHIWKRKYNIITRIFGFNEKSEVAKITTENEAFWKFKGSEKILKPKTPFGYSLNIFRTPNIEALKFLYHKSIAFVYDNDYWKYDAYTNDEAFEKLNDNQQLTFKNRNWGKDLNIFKTPSIDYLKKLYYKSIYLLFDKNTWKTDSYFTDNTFGVSENLQSGKRSFRRIGKELKIFTTPTIENLKSMYNTSMAYVFESNRLEHEMALCTEENNSDQSEMEFNLFKAPTIENLKKLYSKSLRKKE
jgi:LmbE family N-acetylglucosaminyl deacetylase